MEQRLNRATVAIEKFSAALDGYATLQEDVAQLNAYYGSDMWRQDLADDDTGRLPKDLHRGVLSEDGIWNLLTDFHELQRRLQDVGKLP